MGSEGYILCLRELASPSAQGRKPLTLSLKPLNPVLSNAKLQLLVRFSGGLGVQGFRV